MSEASRCGFKKRGIFGRVAAQAQHVLNARGFHVVEHAAQLRAAAAGTRHVRHDVHADLVLNLFGDFHGPGARRAARAVRHRNEGRAQGSQGADGLEQMRVSFVRTRRKEFEREERPLRLQRLAYPHAAPCYRNVETRPPQTSAHPSTITKSSSFAGSDITGGLSMNMPRPIRIEATAKSMATKGR